MEDLDDGAYAVSVRKDLLEGDLISYEQLAETLLSKGAIAPLSDRFSRLASHALVLAQYELGAHQDPVAARAWLAVPFAKKPDMEECISYMREALHASRLWNRELLSLGQTVEPVICLLLLGRTETIAKEFSAVLDGEPLFMGNDKEFLRPTIARHMILASQRRAAEMSESDYQRCRDLKRATVFSAYRMLLNALGEGDSSVFNAELKKCCEAFLKRKSSRLLAIEWGYGKASRWCFDTLGTAICRMAHDQGMSVEAPDIRLYPKEFWQSHP